MQKRLWLYPLIFCLMIAAILACAVRIGWALHQIRRDQIPAGAQLVWEVNSRAAI